MAVQISGNDITVPRDGSFTRNVTIGGTLTYEDVTNIDSVGLVTARTGIEIGARPGVAASISVDGNMVISGIMTAQKSGVFGNTSDSFTALSITSSTSGISELRFADTTANAGYVKYQNSDDTLILATNTSEKLRITSGGLLGIGAGSGTNKPLHIYTGSSDSEIRLHTNSGTEQNAYVSLRNSGGAVDIYSVNSAINLHPANTKRLEALANGNVEITDGDLVIGTSGHGIDFSATADGTGSGSTSEVLDDYEEGTWSPQIGGSTTAGSYNKTGEGYYIKVGRQVTVWLNCTGAVSGASGTTRITGLPFTAASNSASNGYTAVYSAGSAQYWAGFGSADILGALIVVGTTYIYFHTDNGSSTGANQAIQNGSHNAHVHASYFTN